MAELPLSRRHFLHQSAALASLLGVSSHALARRTKPWLGVRVRAVKGKHKHGAQVLRVFRRTDAARQGLRRGDVICALDKHPIKTAAQLIKRIRRHKPGEHVNIVVERPKSRVALRVRLGAVPTLEGLLAQEHVGFPAPPLRNLVTVQGVVPKHLSQLRGKVVVLDFWADWCTVCKDVAPILNEWHRRLRSKGVAVLGIANNGVSAASRGVSAFDMAYPTAANPSGSMFRSYDVQALPTLFMLDKRGIIRGFEVGFSGTGLGKLELLIEKLVRA